jgi:hypothetical protein
MNMLERDQSSSIVELMVLLLNNMEHKILFFNMLIIFIICKYII